MVHFQQQIQQLQIIVYAKESRMELEQEQQLIAMFMIHGIRQWHPQVCHQQHFQHIQVEYYKAQ